MIRHIRGIVAYAGLDYVVLDTGGVGYQIFVGQTSRFKLDSEVMLHTYHALRDTTSDLYGFFTLDELEIFELLLTLPKIGPKSAAQIMSQADIELLKTAIINNDPEHLSKMSGVGKKTAEKIVAGLKDKFEDMGMVAGADNTLSAVASFQTDAIDALISLGYPQSDARRVVQKLPADIVNANDAVRAALKELGQS